MIYGAVTTQTVQYPPVDKKLADSQFSIGVKGTTRHSGALRACKAPV